MTEAVLATRRAVTAAVADLDSDRPVLVGCSGGADSVALAAAAAWVGQRSGPPMGVVIVDHALVPGSDAVAAATADLCESLHLNPVVVCRVDAVAAPGGSGPEAAARSARRDAFAVQAARLDASAVLLGHTRDDQAETVLLQLSRGSGARSLAGMRPRVGMYVRPFLDLPRRIVRQSVRDLGLRVHDDPWNDDERFARVRARHRVLPVLESELGPGIADALARTASLLGDDSDLLDQLAEEAALTVGDEPTMASLADLPRALRTRVIRAAAVRAGCPADALTRDHVLAVEHLVLEPRVSGPVHLPGGFAAVRECGRLLIVRSTHRHHGLEG